MHIKAVTGRYIFDSRGYPTVECDVLLDDGSQGRAAVPSGASTGNKEALELRDGGTEFGGKGVNQAVAHINDTIAPMLLGYDAQNQQALDQKLQELDATGDKSHLGANALLAVSLAAAHAAAKAKQLPLYLHIAELADNDIYTLPMPMVNILNGGQHATGSTDIQEFMIIPVGAPDLPTALRMASETYHALRSVLRDKGFATSVGDEGGFAPQVTRGSTEAIELIMLAISKAGYRPGEDIALALDVAASELFKAGTYGFAREGNNYTSKQLIELYGGLASSYPLVSIEDGLAEDDWQNWQQLTARLGGLMQLVGDDLLVTNPELLEKAIRDKAANAILIKPNQIGTLSETITAVQMAQAAGWQTIISHRSGETEDTTIAHLAVGLNAGQIKTGSFARSEHLAKYNELLRIAENLPFSSLAPFERT